MTPAIAIAELAQLGLPAEKLKEAAMVIEAVIATALIGEEDRKARDRARKARKSEERRGRNRNSADVHGAVRNGAERSEAKSAVDIITHTNLDNNTLPSQQHRSSRASRGTRLPEDWKPHPNILELARTLGFTDAEYWDQFERFKDFWRGVSGAKGVKLDWDATWRNRIKDLADRLKKGPNGQDRSSIARGFDAIRASLKSGSEQGDSYSPEDPFGLPRLRQGAA